MGQVWVTGAGVVSGLGVGMEPFGQALMGGASAVREHRVRVPTSEEYEPCWASKLPEDFVCESAPRTLQPFMDRNTHFALDAADQALKQSGLLERPAELRGRGVIICGVGMAGQHTLGEAYQHLFVSGQKRPHPFTVPRCMPSAPNSIIAMAYQLDAPGFAVSSACATSNHAIGLATLLLRSGQFDWAIVGGTEAGITFAGMRSWRALKVTSDSWSAPFSEGPLGLAIGEGAAMFVLETEANARRANARPLASVLGFGMTSDGAHMTQMQQEKAAKAIQLAIADAGLAPEDVHHINSHGTGTELNDRSECEVIHRVYGRSADRIPVTSTKAAHGHAIGATSALEFAACLIALEQQRVPPTVNFTRLRNGIQLDVVNGSARSLLMENVVSHAFGFGGLNAVLVLGAGAAVH